MQALGDLKHELRIALQASLSAWFPRSLDQKYGGFLCDFDARWNPRGAQNKMLEFQARQTRVAAQAALHDRSLAACRDAADHGFRYLRERMWDDRYGGWYKKLDREGRVLDAGTKHGHGTAYAIQACIEHHRLTGNPESLKLARDAFLWLEKHAHDVRHRGYFSFYQRDGTPILTREHNPVGKHWRDHLGTPIGLKDVNTALDQMDALLDLHATLADRLVRDRAVELLELTLDRLLVAPGFFYDHYHQDWSPAPSPINFGIAVQTANSLLRVPAAFVNERRTEIRQTAQRLVDFCIKFAWDDKSGGFYYSGRIAEGNIVIASRAKEWWVQAEGLRALLFIARACDAYRVDYPGLFQRQWNYVTANLIDAHHKGWHQTGTDTRVGPSAKSHEWKDASHEVRALIECIRMLETA